MGIGGAMDLSSGCRRVMVLTTHRTKKDQAKLVKDCSFPLTAVGVVATVITDLGVFDIDDGAFVVRELAPLVTADEVRDKTSAPVRFP